MTISIIHFSDIHISNSSDLICKRLEKIEQACLSYLPKKGLIIIAISGDIAQSGLKQQYEIAKTFFNDLKSYLQSELQSSINIVCVPGNHDCDYNNAKTYRKTLISNLNSTNIDSDAYMEISRVNEEYFNFANEYYSVDRSSPVIEIPLGEGEVLVRAFNTAWMSTIDETPGKIIMPSYGSLKDYSEYKLVISIMHHPTNWLNPDYKFNFIDDIRKTSNIVLFGHEHNRDSYSQESNDFCIFCNHGKELQISNSLNSGFTILNFDEGIQNFTQIDFNWDQDMYATTSTTKQFHKNCAITKYKLIPNSATMDYINDIGITINHFSKEDVSLTDLYVWPEFKKWRFGQRNNSAARINIDNIDEFLKEKITFICGGLLAGKSALSKKIYLEASEKNLIPIYIKGEDFSVSNTQSIESTIFQAFCKQYSQAQLEEFKQLPEKQKLIIVDDFNAIKNSKNRKNLVFDYLCSYFGHVILNFASEIDIASLINNDNVRELNEIYYYEILPFGNKKRKELISKWYNLGDFECDDVIEEKIENSINQMNTLLGNGSGFLPASPIYILMILQSKDSLTSTTNESKYGSLYESLILCCISKVSNESIHTGEYNIYINILSKLAFDMLENKKTCFKKGDFNQIVNEFCEEQLVELSNIDLLSRFYDVKIFDKEDIESDDYKFKYPYMYYYFAGRYIAYNLKNEKVKVIVNNLSSKLYNEIYGNVLIFVCHFTNNEEIINDIILSALVTLEDYEPFDFSKSNGIFDRIHNDIECLVPKNIVDNSEVDKNKNTKLIQMDNAGIIDGSVKECDDTIDTEITEADKDIASISASFKTMEVLGQIIQNYPGDIRGEIKKTIITELQKLGMRTSQALINMLDSIENDFVEYVVDRESQRNTNFDREKTVLAAKHIINLFIISTISAMINKIADSLNNKYVLPAAEQVFKNDTTISAKLVLLSLKINCLHTVSYPDVSSLKKALDENDEKFASQIVDSIIGHYLNYNKCSTSLRDKLCKLCNLSQTLTLKKPLD